MGTATETYADLINKAAFSTTEVVDHYDGINYLHDGERVILDRLLPEIKGSAILDLGIGAGRTTAFLLDISPNYTGLDFVPELIERAREKYPEANLVVGDATDLRQFENESFDFVLFSYNGLGCISHPGRLKVLREVHRVLRPGGRFMFSAHNRDYKYFRKLPWRRKIEFDKQFAKFFLYALYHLPKHWRMKKHEVETDDYAIVNDSDHRYSVLFYYICPDKQIQQLEDAGFESIEVHDNRGRPVERCVDSHWLEYLAVKP